MANPGRPAPPPPPTRRAQIKVVRAVYKYVANQSDELSFEEGDTLYIIDTSDPNGWWKAKCNNKVGLVPSNYVSESMEEIDNPLHEAAKRGNLPFLQECLANGVSVNGLDKSSATPLYWAAHGGHSQCVQVLLGVANVSINSQNKLGDTPLHACAWKGHAECVSLLLDKHADVTIKNNDGKTPYELSKNPQCGALIQRAARTSRGSVSRNDNEYIDDEDSD
ncbi:osteoclast-stimulating factor 1-like [Watersipora subatra]|uniref:osteoclast-stimulating factor 1-like n=1 Tax=Watersipora subatra TaxID=2589382 RepID=UPI00355B491D